MPIWWRGSALSSFCDQPLSCQEKGKGQSLARLQRVMNTETLASRPPLPETPLEAIVGGRTFLIDKPSQSERLLDHPAIRSAFAADDYMPYWADLWPSARMLAKVIVQENWTLGTEALEIGCGLGLPGVAALAMGLRV